MPVSKEGSYKITDAKGIQYVLVIQYRELVAMFLYYLDGRRISVHDRYGYTYDDTGKPITKSLVSEIDKLIYGEVLPLETSNEEESG